MIRARTLALTALAICAGAPLGAQSGAIFTTDKYGAAVNANKYSKPDAVFLRASGFPDGEYYFQVTNTSGTVLLSQDAPASRTVTIAGGIIVDAGDHPLASELKGKPGSPDAVQLAPFTQHADGHYKVWLTSSLVSGGGLPWLRPEEQQDRQLQGRKGQAEQHGDHLGHGVLR